MVSIWGRAAAARLSVLGAIGPPRMHKRARADGAYAVVMEYAVELPVALPDISVVRATTSSPHTGVKEHYGVGRIERGGCDWWGAGKVWRADPGCILVKQPGDVVRHLAHNGPTTFTAVRLPAADVARVRDEGRAVSIVQLDPTDERAAPFHRLIDAAHAGADRLALEVAVAEAVSALAHLSTSRPDYSRPVRRAMEYLRERLADSFTLDDLAEHADLDKFHLCRAFRAQIGLPPHRYLTHLRIARAKELLAGGVRASSVAPLVGICDQAQLTRHFRRLVGTTPARYASDRRTGTHSPRPTSY
jgi:AraC-like DNA-binding protein